MRFDMEIQFNSGVMTGDGDDDAAMLIELGRLLVAKAGGLDDELIGIEGGRTKTVGDIRSIRIEAQF